MSTEVEIPVGGASVHGDLACPADAGAIVVFAHGSGSSRHSSRNRTVARRLGEHGLATLLVDLLTDAEDKTDRRSGRLRFDIGLLAQRLAAAADWVTGPGGAGHLPLGYFGASTGAAAALVAAAGIGPPAGAVVSRGGRPDLAGDALTRVVVPTLLIVGSRDELVLELNRRAAARLGGPHRIEVVVGATHLFEERGALEAVADLAAAWFIDHLAPAPGGGPQPGSEPAPQDPGGG